MSRWVVAVTPEGSTEVHTVEVEADNDVDAVLLAVDQLLESHGITVGDAEVEELP